MPIFYESRLPELQIIGQTLDQVFDRVFADRSEDERATIRQRFATEQVIAAAPRRIEAICLDLIDHFTRFIAPDGFKAQVVATSRHADLRWLGKIRGTARARYRDDRLDLSGCGEKVRKLIADAVAADGIRILVKEVPLFSPEFEEKVGALETDDAKASEMEHAIRHEINVRVEENPVFYQSLRERLEAIIEERRQQRLDAAEQLSLLAVLREKLRDEQTRAQDIGLDGAGIRDLRAPRTPAADAGARGCRHLQRGQPGPGIAHRRSGHAVHRAGRLVAEGRPAATDAQQPAQVRSALIAWFRRHAERRLPERVAAWRAKAGVRMPSVIVSNQQKRWGSCDRNGAIRLNWRIIQAPMRLVDYIVVHELVHLRHRGHGREYWQAPGRVMPGLRAPAGGSEEVRGRAGVVVVVATQERCKGRSRGPTMTLKHVLGTGRRP